MTDESAAHHECASCRQLIPDAARFQLEAHGADCRQPEIRMRRVEAQLQQLGEAMRNLVEGHNETVESLTKLGERVGVIDTSAANSIAMLRAVIDETVQTLTGVSRVQGKMADILETLKHGSRETHRADTSASSLGALISPAGEGLGWLVHRCQGGVFTYPGCEACAAGGPHSHGGAAEPECPPTTRAVHPGGEGGDSGPDR